MREFGPPGVLQVAEVPEPVAAEGEVVVEAVFASVTFVETQIRAGRAPNPAMAPALPAILGNGMGAVVDGAPVVTTTGGLGGYAERAAVPVAGLIEVPDGVSSARRDRAARRRSHRGWVAGRRRAARG